MKDHPGLPAHGVTVAQILVTTQTMAPPSVHPDTKETLAWEANPGDIPNIAPAEIECRMGVFAALTVVTQFFPPKGVRHDTVLALYGTLCRVPWIIAQPDRVALVDRLVTMAARTGGRPARPGDEHKAAETFKKLEDGEQIWGVPKLCELIGVPEDVAGKMREWLGLSAGVEDGRTQIVYSEIDDLRVLDETQRVLLTAGAPIFQRAGQLEHVFRLEREEKVVDQNGKVKWSRPAGSLVIKPVGADRLRLYLSESIQYVVPRKGDDGKATLVRIRAPRSVASDFIAMDDAWRLRVLRGIAETPTLREDGSLLVQEGYDEQSRLVLDSNGAQFEAIPENPTKEDAERALRELDKVLAGFPFDGNADGSVPCPSRSVALSLILSSLIVGALPHIPMHLGDAAAPGTGKGLLGDVASIIATGRTASRMAQGRDEAEDEKRLVGAVLQGAPMLMIDNVEQALGGDFLCTIITDGKVQVRVLGQTGQHEVDVRMLIYATGNNVKVRGDMVRRAVKCRMDANCEKPEDRKFDGDLKAYVLKQRGKLVSAALTIVRAFAVAADRQEVLDKLPPYNGFEHWSERVRGSLVWLGEADPCATRDSVRDDDPVTTSLTTLIAAWVGNLKTAKLAEGSNDGWYTTGEICAAANEADPHDRGALVRPALHDALQAIMPRGVTPDGLGRFLSRFVDRIVGDYRLRKRKHPTTREKQYLVEPTTKAEGSTTAGVGLAEGEFNFGLGEKQA